MGAVHEIIGPQCQALDLSDALRGVSEATVHDGLFCRLCAKQCFGLYASKTLLASQQCEGVTSEGQVHEVHDYLFR
ncbi:hypothetical protein NEMBOFW57_000176 [Staphylotrichum longicolle]|uniref:Uncharacterized protein n=1 Tax=Staphylotrichum longicolle TaxID=669026 RepID=A0AAD4I2P8_9PEZI|nr:hypothetical protein NEMBOFW57_000176 [Staphylotrichum longicolle]